MEKRRKKIQVKAGECCVSKKIAKIDGKMNTVRKFEAKKYWEKNEKKDKLVFFFLSAGTGDYFVKLLLPYRNVTK